MAKAIVKAAAGNQRAAFAIEAAIADTTRRITGGGAKGLQQKAQAALAKPEDSYKFGGATARNLLRFACDGIKPAKGFDRMVSDVHALLKGEAGERGRDGLCDGLVYLTQADYSSESKSKAKATLSSGPRLQTERDGRIFAVDVLERLKNADADKATAYPYFDASYYGSDETIEPFRKGPQWDGFYRDLSHLLTGTEEARKGFASIFTDCLVEDIGFNLDVYREMEAKTLFQDFGTAGTKYQAPKRKPVTKAEKAANAAEVAKARGPQVAPSEAEATEKFLTDKRQLALRHDAIVFLAHGYDEMLKSIKRNKKDAEYYAEASAALKVSQENYMIIYMRLSEAARGMAQAISQRKDGAQILRRAQQNLAKAIKATAK